MEDVGEIDLQCMWRDFAQVLLCSIGKLVYESWVFGVQNDISGNQCKYYARRRMKQA